MPVRTRQPQGTPRLARTALTRGLVGVWNLADGPRLARDLVTGRYATVSGTVARVTTPQGAGIVGTGSTNHLDTGRTTGELNVDADKARTVLIVTQWSNASAEGAMFSLGGAGGDEFFYLRKNDATTGMRYETFSPATDDFTVAEAVDRMPVVAIVTKRPGAPGAAYINGRLRTAGTGEPVLTTLGTGPFRIGGNGFHLSWDRPVLLACVWDRELSASEVVRLSANPWQIFAARNDDVFAASGGISATTATAAAGAATVSATGASTAAAAADTAAGAATVSAAGASTAAAAADTAAGAATVSATGAGTAAAAADTAAGAATVSAAATGVGAAVAADAAGAATASAAGASTAAAAADTAAGAATASAVGSSTGVSAAVASAAAGVATVSAVGSSTGAPAPAPSPAPSPAKDLTSAKYAGSRRKNIGFRPLTGKRHEPDEPLPADITNMPGAPEPIEPLSPQLARGLLDYLGPLEPEPGRARAAPPAPPAALLAPAPPAPPAPPAALLAPAPPAPPAALLAPVVDFAALEAAVTQGAGAVAMLTAAVAQLEEGMRAQAGAIQSGIETLQAKLDDVAAELALMHERQAEERQRSRNRKRAQEIASRLLDS